MAFEYPTFAGTVRLAKVGAVGRFNTSARNGGIGGGHLTTRRARLPGTKRVLPQWDECREPVSQDIIDWRPPDDSI
jgi:hypothetical protein